MTRLNLVRRPLKPRLSRDVGARFVTAPYPGIYRCIEGLPTNIRHEPERPLVRLKAAVGECHLAAHVLGLQRRRDAFETSGAVGDSV